MRTSLITKLSLVGALSLFAACGVKLGNVGPEGQQEASNTAENGTAGKDKVTVPVSIAEQKAAGLNLADGGLALADASTFEIDIAGCASGYIDTLTQNDPTPNAIDLYISDKDCVAKLNKFTSNGVLYTRDPGYTGDFHAGSDINFMNGSLVLQVKVVSQLTIGGIKDDGSEAIRYSFTQTNVEQIDSAISAAEIIAGGSITVSGEEAPKFTMKSHAYKKLSSDGKPQFQFKLDCTTGMVAAASGHPASESTCNGQQLGNIKYAMGVDPTDGQPSSQVSLSALEAISATGYVADGSGTEAIVQADPSVGADWAHGGIHINAANGIPSAATIHSTGGNKLLLVVRYQNVVGGDVTYTYFRIQFAQVGNH